METSNLVQKEFKVVSMKMLTGLERRLEELSENVDKEIDNFKRTSQS